MMFTLIYIMLIASYQWMPVPSMIFYKLYSFTDQGQMLIRSSESMEEMLDLYDTYMEQAEEKRKAACGGQLSIADMLGGDSSAG